jgi:hypothetical protein
MTQLEFELKRILARRYTELAALEHETHILRRVLDQLAARPFHPTHIVIGEQNMAPQAALIGLAVGKSEILRANAADPSGNFGPFPAGDVPTWESDNPNVVLDASIDPSGLTVRVTVLEGAKAGDEADIFVDTASGLSSGQVPFPVISGQAPPPPGGFKAATIVITESPDTGAANDLEPIDKSEGTLGDPGGGAPAPVDTSNMTPNQKLAVALSGANTAPAPASAGGAALTEDQENATS